MRKWLGTFFIDFVCDDNDIDKNIGIIQCELQKLNFADFVEIIKYDCNSDTKFVAIIKLVCSNECNTDKTIINTYVLFNHIVKQINNASGFNWSLYDDYNCKFDHRVNLAMIYSKNYKENLCGFPIKCDVPFSLCETDELDSFSESLNDLFSNLSL